MARFLIAPGSFKGTLSSAEAGRTMQEALREVLPDSQARCLAMADGGEGTLEALLAMTGGEMVEAQVAGPAGTPVRAPYAVLADGTAVIEMSAACGTRLAPEGLSPSKATTYGVGELMLDAVRRGCGKVVLGLGGSATTDGGCGALEACGVRFLDKYVEPFSPTGSTLGQLVSIDASGVDPALRAAELQVLCAVRNPLCGPMGTSATFAAGKGALPAVVAALDANLAHYASVLERDLGRDVLDLRCGGAGGGTAAGLSALFGVEPQLGIDWLLDRCGFDERLANVDYVLTGEGAFDAQSLHGKVVSGIARRCKQAGVPLVAVVGSMDEMLADAGHALGVSTFAVLNAGNVPLSQITKHPRSQLARTVMHVGSLIAQGGQLPRVVGPLPPR